MSSNLSRRSQRKRQTRLAFDPVEPTSSATMSPARIRYNAPSSPEKASEFISPARKAKGVKQYQFPSGKGYAVVIEAPKKQKKDGILPFKVLTTPARSSRAQTRSSKRAISISGDLDTDPETVETFRRQQASRFSKPGSPRADFLSSGGRRPLAGADKVLSTSKKRYKMAYDGALDDSSAGSLPEEDENLTRHKSKYATAKKATAKKATPKKKATPRNKPATLKSTTISDDDNGSETSLESPTRASMKNGLAVLPGRESTPDADLPKMADMRSLISGGNINFSQKSRKNSQKKKVNGVKSLSRSRIKRREDSETRTDDEDAIAILPTPQQVSEHRTNKKQATISDDSEYLDVAPQTSQMMSERSPKWIDDGSSEDDEPLPSSRKNVSSGRNRRTSFALEEDEEVEEEVHVRSSARRRLRKRVEMEDKERSLDDDDDDDDDEDPISSPLKRRRMVAEDDEESDPFTSPSKRFRPAPMAQSSADDNLSRNATRVTRQQQQQQRKPHRTVREKKLELLRRQRAGEKIIELTSSESDDGSRQLGIYDSNSDLEVLSEFEDEEVDENGGIEEVRRPLLPSDQSNNDDEFVVDDDNDPLGIPEVGLNDIPLQFTHHAHKPLKEHFKDAVEWMIQNKINPAFNRKDPVYSQAFRKLDIEVQGYASSVYSSTVWKEAFTRALWARPIFLERALTPGDEQEGNKCDACGRTNHPATFEVQFSGKAYYKETLDEVDNDHGEDGEDGEDDSRSMTSVNSNGHSIPGADVSWFVGRFCKANAQTAHSLIHWKHALNDWVIDRLKSDGYLEARKLAEREDWSTNKRSKYANRIVDEWEAEKEIKALYRDFKINLDVARQGKATRWGKK